MCTLKQPSLWKKKNVTTPLARGIYLTFVVFKIEALFVFNINQPIRFELIIAIHRLHPDQISQCHENKIQPTDFNLTEWVVHLSCSN